MQTVGRNLAAIPAIIFVTDHFVAAAGVRLMLVFHDARYQTIGHRIVRLALVRRNGSLMGFIPVNAVTTRGVKSDLTVKVGGGRALMPHLEQFLVSIVKHGSVELHAPAF